MARAIVRLIVIVTVVPVAERLILRVENLLLLYIYVGRISITGKIIGECRPSHIFWWGGREKPRLVSSGSTPWRGCIGTRWSGGAVEILRRVVDAQQISYKGLSVPLVSLVLKKAIQLAQRCLRS
jgi:hypothetical protein